MHSSFTQIYAKTAKLADEMINQKELKELQMMPLIENAEEVLKDIYNLGKKEPKTNFIK